MKHNLNGNNKSGDNKDY